MAHRLAQLTCTHFNPDCPSNTIIHSDGIQRNARTLVTLVERQSPILELALHVSYTRNELHVPALAHPDGRLVRRLKAMDGTVGVVVRRHRDVVLTRLSNLSRKKNLAQYATVQIFIS